ncbi:MAG: ATP-dependent helicase [Chloroflexi bacterium]|nr:ATP-dependent helicase [Chloroflexota bacterium]
MNLRPTQADILEYRGGKMAVSAVPGSGKTFTLTRLAAQLLADKRLDPTASQQILIVTYLNTSVDNFRAAIRKRLEELNQPTQTGYDVRTLHSLGLEIVRIASGGEQGNDLIVLDDGQAVRYLGQAIDNWQTAHPHQWNALLPEDSPQAQVRWRGTVERTAQAFIRTAKNERYAPEQVQAKLPIPEQAADPTQLFLCLLAGIYANYQAIITRQGALDFNDLIAQAADLVESRPDVQAVLRQRWPYVLEDEAQDSAPLQEILLNALTGENGNWVRVGDPNQAITTTFTAAHPRYLNAFLDRADVQKRPLPHSGRCAPKIIQAANLLVDWVCDKHPVPEVRQHAFRQQHILPTPPGDAQQNPPDSEAGIVIKAYGHREDEELPKIAQLAHLYTQRRPHHTVAILVPTNDTGHKLSEHLDSLEAHYDNQLRGGQREREIAAALHALLALLANPIGRNVFAEVHKALADLEHPAAHVPEGQSGRFQALLQSIYRPELLLFPEDAEDFLAALPPGVLRPEELPYLTQFIYFLQRLFPLRLLPIDDLVIALSDELFATARDQINETDLAIAYQIANVLRRWYDMEPDWRLPQLAGQLEEIARGRRQLAVLAADEDGYEPKPGRITLTTQHRAKGLEWDGVFVVGVDNFWVPSDLDSPFLGVDADMGGDPTAEAIAQLQALMTDQPTTYAGLDATQSAHIDVICERLRLLYVAITRARRFLHISRSRKTRTYQKERDAEPTTVMGVLYEYVKGL